VFAGSALWLDCRALVQPVDSLIEVSWYRDDELIYQQFPMHNGRLIHYPPNRYTGLTLCKFFFLDTKKINKI